MITVGAFEAKTHLSRLLDQVAAGEEVTITKHGKPVARLVKAAPAAKPIGEDLLAEMKHIRMGSSLGGLSWKELRDEGRK